MSVLFIDSSYDITLGLLNEKYEWLDFRTFRGQRASNTLQTETFRLLKEMGVGMKDLSAVVTIAGPGFYTGLRLSEGFADVTKFFQIPHYSFYSHEIPGWLGHHDSAWVTKAYRGEYFIYQDGQQKLIETKDLADLKLPTEVFIHSETALDEKLRAIAGNAKSTLELLKESPRKIFKHVFHEKLIRESFYFRAPEDEFRMNP